MSNIIKYVAVALFFVMNASVFTAFGQTVSKPTNNYTMRPDSPNKPEMRQIIVRLKGDKGISIVDLITGKVVARNFAPYVNSQGMVEESNYSNPVIDDLFSICRMKKDGELYSRINGKLYRNWRQSITVYRNASHPVPVPGLTDLYSANIINPQLFPISRYGERIKFVDNKGNEKFTVMPIDGKEPYAAMPVAWNGLFVVEVDYKNKNEPISKWGAIDTTGKWIVYPEWDRLEPGDGIRCALFGFKGGWRYLINSEGKYERNKQFNYEEEEFLNDKHLIETFFNKERAIYITNIYDAKQNYLATIDNAGWIRPNHIYPNIFCVRRNWETENSDYDNLVDLSKHCAVISKEYSYLEMLPDGNYLGRTDDTTGKITKYWYVTANGTASPLPAKCEYPLRHPTMELLYKPEIKRFLVMAKDGASGYICDFQGNKVGTLEIEEFTNSKWEAEPVQSSYWDKNCR